MNNNVIGYAFSAPDKNTFLADSDYPAEKIGQMVQEGYGVRLLYGKETDEELPEPDTDSYFVFRKYGARTIVAPSDYSKTNKMILAGYDVSVERKNKIYKLQENI